MTLPSSIVNAVADSQADDQSGVSDSLDYVIVAYRSARHIVSCLDSISADRPEGSRIIVVDNCSPDESGLVAEAHASNPLIITSSTNLGFGAACNMAVRDTKAPFVFFVNPDATLEPGATEMLLDVLTRDNRVGAVGPRIADRDDDLSAASAGFEPSIRSVAGHFLLLGRIPGFRRLFAPLQLPAGTRERSPDWVSGAALMVRRSAFVGIDGFDPTIFMYMEDVDLCRRLRGTGWTIRYEPRAVVKHQLGGSQGPEQAERWYSAFHLYLRVHHGPPTAVICSLMAAVGMLARAARLRRSKPAHARRLARAGRAALRLALGQTVDIGPSGARDDG